MLDVSSLLKRRVSIRSQTASDQLTTTKMSSNQQSSFGMSFLTAASGPLPPSFTQFREPLPPASIPPNETIELVRCGQFLPAEVAPTALVSASQQVRLVDDNASFARRAIESYHSELVKRDERIHSAQRSADAM